MYHYMYVFWLLNPIWAECKQISCGECINKYSPRLCPPLLEIQIDGGEFLAHNNPAKNKSYFGYNDYNPNLSLTKHLLRQYF